MVRLSGKKYKKIALYAVIIAAIFLPGTVKYCRLSIQKAQNESKLKVLIQENRRLTEENKKLKEDPVYIEKTVRENLGLAKKGEVVVKFKNQITTDKIQ
jgi:cell division protein FtsB